MSLVRAPEIRSLSQRRFERVAFWSLCCAGFAFGLCQAYECARIIYGYVAAYSFAGAIGSAIMLVTVGLLLTVFWRTRAMGVGFVLAGILSCVTFYAGGWPILCVLCKGWAFPKAGLHESLTFALLRRSLAAHSK
jgi:hypothetical protein